MNQIEQLSEANPNRVKSWEIEDKSVDQKDPWLIPQDLPALSFAMMSLGDKRGKK